MSKCKVTQGMDIPNGRYVMFDQDIAKPHNNAVILDYEHTADSIKYREALIDDGIRVELLTMGDPKIVYRDEQHIKVSLTEEQSKWIDLLMKRSKIEWSADNCDETPNEEIFEVLPGSRMPRCPHIVYHPGWIGWFNVAVLVEEHNRIAHRHHKHRAK